MKINLLFLFNHLALKGRVKILFYAAVLIFNFQFSIFNSAFGQAPGQWVWLHGSKTTNDPGTFGTQGVPSRLNDPPGLYEACEWTDTSGNFWLYGGAGLGGSARNDLWRYNPRANEWTWMTGTNSASDTGNYGIQGVPSPTNRPPSKALGIVSWVDHDGKFWMFGGNGGGGFSDLWKYDPLTNEWTWMKGPKAKGQLGIYGIRGVPDSANNPGCRWETAAGWTDDAGDLWMFGGTGVYNDTWRYNIATNMWTWMKGSTVQGQSGSYGQIGVEDSLSNPSCRAAYTHWKDKKGNLWFFGGYDFYNRNYQDLWRFNPATNNWTWMNGSNSFNKPGSYGTKCVTNSTNIPGARMENRANWMDSKGNFWMFGGFYSPKRWNDLWMYCIGSNQWIWISGDSISNPTGNWGIKTLPSYLNKPNGRYGSVSWTDNKGGLYFFGGHGVYNDVWKYQIDTTCGVCPTTRPASSLQADSTDICVGSCVDFKDISSNYPSYWQWNFPGGVPSSSSIQNPVNICYPDTGSYDVMLVSTNFYGSDTIILHNYITVHSPPMPPPVTRNDDTLFVPQGFVAYQWYYFSSPISGATDYFYVATQSGYFGIDVTDIYGCHVFTDYLDIVAGTETISSLENKNLIFIFPNPANDKLSVARSASFGKEVQVEIYNTLGEKIRKMSAMRETSFVIDIGLLRKGIYLLKLSGDNGSAVKRFVKE